MAQCKGTTKSGNRCKITTGVVDGYCRMHIDQAPATENEPVNEELHDIPREEELPFTDVASEVNRGVSAIWLVITAVLSIILFWLFKGKKKPE